MGRGGEEIASRLSRLLDREGPPLLEDPARARALLQDLLHDREREAWLLSAALELGLHHDLLAAGTEAEGAVERLAGRLERERCIKAGAARWTVLALAAGIGLRVPSPGELGQEAPAPRPAPCPPAAVPARTTPAPAAPSLACRYEAMESVAPSLLFRLEHSPDRLAPRIIDLFCPLGRGQRCLVSAPRAGGKTALLQDIARGFAAQGDDLWLAGLQLGYRPEEGQELQAILGDRVFTAPDDAVAAAEVADCLLDDAMRLSLQGYDAVLLVDSLTHLARTYAQAAAARGGGLDDESAAGKSALLRFFGSGRNLRKSGSITIVGTALEGGGAADEQCLQALGEVANSQICLDRDMLTRRLYPNIILPLSETREEARLLPGPVLRASHWLRQKLDGLDPAAAMEQLGRRMNRHPRNRLMLEAIWAGER